MTLLVTIKIQVLLVLQLKYIMISTLFSYYFYFYKHLPFMTCLRRPHLQPDLSVPWSGAVPSCLSGVLLEVLDIGVGGAWSS